MEYSVKIELKGFESIDKFRLKRVDETFAVLESLDSSIQLSLVNPYKLTNYSFDVPNVAKALLQLQSESNVDVFLVLLLSNPKEESRANFLAPIIFNNDNGFMGQVILNGKEYKNYKMNAQIKEFTE